jgi:putative membrane protein
MSVAAFLWRKTSLKLERSQLSLLLAVYLTNFAFGATIAGVSGFPIPVILGLLLGVVPILTLWWMAQPTVATVPVDPSPEMPIPVEVALK